MDNLFLGSAYQEEDNFWDVVTGNSAGEKIVNVLNKSAFRTSCRPSQRFDWVQNVTHQFRTCHFKTYMKETEQRMMSEVSSSKVNVKKRIVNLLRKKWEEQKNAAAPEIDRCWRLVMTERTRREKQKQSFLALHSLLPFFPKNNRNAIIEKAIDEIGYLLRLKKELERKIEVIEEKSNKDGEMSETKVRFNQEEPLSGLDSMLEVLQCLKSMQTKIKTVEANFSPQEFSATMNIETQISGEEVEKRVERRLQENEWELLFLSSSLFLKDFCVDF